MKLIIAAILGLALQSASAQAAGHPPIWSHDPGIVVIAQGGNTPIKLVNGDNVIDGPRTFYCRSDNGCLVTLAIWVAETNTLNSKTCALVDGVEATPKCDADVASPVIRRSFVEVGAGPHTVETDLQTNSDTGKVTSWEVEYIIYQRR